MSQQSFVALLRGINVSGRNLIPMAELRAVCAALGWREVRSYIQSGNLVFAADEETAVLEHTLEQAIRQRFALAVPVIVRPTARWSDYLNSNPFLQASQVEANRVMLALAKSLLLPDAAERLQERAAATERIRQSADALWIHFGEGAGQSKLTTALLDKLVGSPVTMRNWRTVLKIGEMARELGVTVQT
jgi:uncharacterized protein (DUF1697 family)